MAAIGDDSDIPHLISDSDPECMEGDVDDDDDDDNEWDDVEDNDEEKINVLTGDVSCLFCPCVEPSVESLLSHCSRDHNFDLIDSCRRWSVDCISYIKMVNYIRREKPSIDVVKVGLSENGLLWSSDSYMKAANPDDLLLQFDIEWAQTDISQNATADAAEFTNVDEHNFDKVLTESKAVCALIDRVHKAEAGRNLLKEELERALEDIQRLKLASQQLVMCVHNKSSEPRLDAVHDTALHEEDGYFASYSHHDIHLTMLKDKVRTESYRDFMMQNPNLFKGKLVLDVGCGTGILSMFAAKAGAGHVVAVDQSAIIYQAMDIARENNLHDKITFVKGRLEDVKLPIEKFNIIISEWMGYFLLFEAMLDSVLCARDSYLLPGGCVYPDHFSMFVVGVSDPDMRRAKVEFWDDVYGFKMSCMKSSVIDEVHIKLVKEETVITEPAMIKSIDVMKCKVTDLDFSTEFSLKCRVDADITAVVGYFDTDFVAGCQNKVSFSTGPHAPPTHWEQAVMLLPAPIPVKQGSSLDCKMTYRKHPHDSRGIIIHLRIGSHKLKYSLS